MKITVEIIAIKAEKFIVQLKGNLATRNEPPDHWKPK